MDWISHHRLEIDSLALIACGVWWLMPRTAHLPKIVGLVLAMCGAGLLSTRLNPAGGHAVQTVLFSTFAAVDWFDLANSVVSGRAARHDDRVRPLTVRRLFVRGGVGRHAAASGYDWRDCDCAATSPGDSVMGDVESYLAVGAVLFVLGA